ncbi:MAG: M23 family metallopeptidase [Chlorobiales bacterium]|nr:M23 family metallopeptidase [Chlorobiales bacterium]
MLEKKKTPAKTYTITIIPEDGSETKGYTNVTREQVVGAVATGVVLIGIVVFLLIAFTPIRRLVPGYGSAKEYEKSIVQTQLRLDSLTSQLVKLDAYNRRLKGVLGIAGQSNDSNLAMSAAPAGKVMPALKAEKEVPKAAVSIAKVPDPVGQAPSNMQKYPAFVGSIVRGSISQDFMPEKSHYGIDIATAVNEPIGAIADGTVLFADWTYDYGYTVVIDHGGLISFYKHCNQTFVREGARVRRGEVIALAGNTGHETTGAHLHMEIWKNGVPQNPAEYLDKNK